MPKIADRGVTSHILKAFNLHASKRLGQNFLIDAGVVNGIVATAEIEPGDRVLEIGPGIGTLTQALAEAGADVTAVELDKKLPAVLAETLKAYDNVRIVPGDILKTDIRALMGDEPFKVVANLPYYITTPIIMALLEQKLPITRIVTMVQKEVAERMTAEPGGKDYGALSVAVQYYTEPEFALNVPPKCFMPAPAVDSAVMDCVVRTEPPVDVKDEKMFFRVVKASFGQRRKTLTNALTGVGISKDDVKTVLSTAGVEGTRRGETLTLSEFAALADAVTALNKN
ncbi:MAG: 16S rRNA (adenine(1518)-N(6)/adenine(1519)-N(6))-dimethyltransferase RsmA [Schwartzia sp.]|nr:16S rRNA (adenine(1518)-N(6)/adenine(1519)-N(6))-dimethyltransferase RsmA [Schwartzia sp. (in: firmicutes)]